MSVQRSPPLSCCVLTVGHPPLLPQNTPISALSWFSCWFFSMLIWHKLAKGLASVGLVAIHMGWMSAVFFLNYQWHLAFFPCIRDFTEKEMVRSGTCEPWLWNSACVPLEVFLGPFVYHAHYCRFTWGQFSSCDYIHPLLLWGEWSCFHFHSDSPAVCPRPSGTHHRWEASCKATRSHSWLIELFNRSDCFNEKAMEKNYQGYGW